MPASSVALFHAAVFVIFSSIGFAVDIFMRGRQPRAVYWLVVFLSGAFAAGYASAGTLFTTHQWRLWAVLLAAHFAVMTTIYRVSPMNPLAVEVGQFASRMTVDAIGMVAAIAAGYVLFVLFFIREGDRYFRARTELKLAAEIQTQLVPTIEQRIGGFEFFAASQASGDMGGDLVDLVEARGCWVAYIADVSGHGVAPGLVMGMVKSAMRMRLETSSDSALLDALNRVITPLMKPNMFVTFGYLRGDEHGLTFALAGHPPVLRVRSGQVEELTCENLPLGISEASTFANSPVEVQAGDLIALVTDGFLEPEDSAGREFGTERVKRVLSAHAADALPEVYLALCRAVDAHGPRLDDRSALLVRKA